MKLLVTCVVALLVSAAVDAALCSSGVKASSTCSVAASNALAGVADGLSSTWGVGPHPENKRVLKSALVSSARLRACGDERASISAELIASDAYGDVFPDKPQLRCAALRDARDRLRALGDVRRTHLVTATLADCH